VTPSAGSRLAALAGLALLLGALPSPAQSPEPVPAAPPAAEAPAAAPAAAEPTPIPAAEVADRAQEESERVRAIRERAEPEAAEAEIAQDLVASAEEVAGLAGAARERLAGSVSRTALDRVSFDFARLRDRLGEWSGTLTRRAESLDADLALLAERRQTWLATREKAVADSQPAAVIARIAATLREIERAERTVRERRNQILTLRESVAHHQSTVAEVLDLVARKRSERRRSYLTLDRPPLWQAMAEAAPEQGGLLARMAAARANDLESLRAFAGDRAIWLMLLAGAVLAGIAAAVSLRRSARRLAESDAAFAVPARVLERPVSAGLVVGLLAGALLLSNPPPVVQGLGQAVAVVAALRLLLLLVQPQLRPILYGLVASFALDRLRDRLVPDLLASRLVLLAIALFVVAALLWLLRPARLAALGELARRGSASLRAIALGTRLSLLASAASVVSNAVGNTALAEVLVEGTLATALFAFVAAALARVLEGFWALLLRGRAGRSLRMVRNHESLVRRRGAALIRAGIAISWAWYSLRAFDAADAVLAGIAAALGAQWSAGELTISLGGVLGFALMIAASIWIARFVRFALEEDVLARTSLPRGVPFAISTLARYAILLVGFSMALLVAGFEMGRLALMVGALGVGIGIGLQDIVNNVVSGLILLFERPVQVGDTVELGTVRGEVRRIGIRSSTVRTFDGAEIVIPNSKLVSESFVNWTLSDRQRRIEIPVGVAYGTDPDRVIELLDRVVRARPEFLAEPPPVVLFERLGESSLDFLVRVWTPDFDTSRRLHSLLLLDIHRALRDAGIEIPFPQRDLHVRSAAPSAATAPDGGAAPGRPEARPAAASRSG
jgi:small-conductance mechanosensitive channel